MSEDFVLPSMNDLFHDEKGYIEINLSEIDEFPNHPFKVNDNDDMESLKNSILEHGVISPAVVRRKPDGRYELISGHRRKKASELAGLKTLKCEIVDVNDDEAVMQMVDGNLQRTTIFPSEKAFAYKMKLEAIKHSRQVGEETSVKKLSKDICESERQIQRYIRLTLLIKSLLDLVDDNKLKMAAALEVTYLDKDTQESLFRKILELNKIPNAKQAKELKDYSEQGYISDEDIELILLGSLKNDTDENEETISSDNSNKEISNNIDFRKILEAVPGDVDNAEEYILKALEFYKNSRQIGKERSLNGLG